MAEFANVRPDTLSVAIQHQNLNICTWNGNTEISNNQLVLINNAQWTDSASGQGNEDNENPKQMKNILRFKGLFKICMFT